MAKTICGVKRPCEQCKAAIWNEDYTQVIGCNFGHTKEGKPLEKVKVKKKKPIKQNISAQDVLRGIIIADIFLMTVFLVMNIFVNKSMITFVVLCQFFILIEALIYYNKLKGELPDEKT